MSDEIVTADETPIVVEVEAELVSEADAAYRGDNPVVTSETTNEDGTWQLTEQEAAVAVVEAATIEAAAEIQQSLEEAAQTTILAQLDSRLNQFQESLTLAMEAQTRAITNLESTLSGLPNSLATETTATTKPKRRNPAQRAEERRKRLADKRANRRQ